MSHPRHIHSVHFGYHEHDDINAAGLPRDHHPEPDPLSPTFGQIPDGLVSPSSPPTGLEAIHPAAVEAARELQAAHNAHVQFVEPARVSTPTPAPAPASASASDVAVDPAAGPSIIPPEGDYLHNQEAGEAEDGYGGSTDPYSPTFGATSPTLGLSPSGSPTMGTFSLYDIGMSRNPIRDSQGTLVSPTPARLPLPPPIDLDKVTAKLTNKEVFANTGLVFKPEPPAPIKKEEPGDKEAVKKGILGKLRREKPKPRYVPETRWIRFQLWFNTYRKFFTFIVIFQLIGMILAGTHHFPYARKNTGGIVVGNIMAAVIVRNEIFGRFLYLTVNTLFAKWPPLWFRLTLTSILQHLGGIHSGCSVSALGWLILNLTYLFRDRHNQNKGVLTMGFIVMFIIAFACLSAFPIVRNTHHNVFERNHRLFGWIAVVVTWIYVILANGYRNNPHQWHSNGHAMGVHQELWLTLIMSIAVILPWLFTYKVPVHVELPSQKVAVLRFERGMQQGLLGRISRTAILEYHAFGTISEGTDAKHHYMVCGVQGDFTRGLVRDQPTHIWTRELKFAGVGNTSTLYRRGIRICTGTGIGAALSTCLQSDQWFLIWVGSDMLKTFGPTIAELIQRGVGPDRCILWDTKKSGRPKTMRLLAETVEKWQAEVVFITSNWDGNEELMQGCKRLGIPAFGTFITAQSLETASTAVQLSSIGLVFLSWDGSVAAPARGIAGAIIFSCIGASYGTAKSGVGIASMAVTRPDMMMRCCIAVVMAGIIAIYGLVVSVVLADDLKAGMPLFTAFVHLGAGLSVGLSGLAAGFAIGIVGDAGARGAGIQPRLFVGMVHNKGTRGDNKCAKGARESPAYPSTIRRSPNNQFLNDKRACAHEKHPVRF
ncbi:hypothetical protein FRC07_007310 [Ceratobasidium sp. 392]|nr:hypothetical protein FRC07_007310 [Ceratobasidium sp. 392]